MHTNGSAPVQVTPRITAPPTPPPAAPSPLPGPRLLTANQVAKMYGVTVRTIWRFEEMGRIPRGVRLTRSTVRWRESDIVQHLASL
jgi:predicted DNA-binding transcriptional regulator AlpA